MLVIPESWKPLWGDQDVFSWLLAIEGKVYREKDGRKTFSFSLEGRNYYAKVHRGIGWKRLISDLLKFRVPVIGAQNEWKAIQLLEKLGIQTMRLVGYGKTGWNPARLKSFVITEELTGTTSLEDYCHRWRLSPPPYRLKKALIQKVAHIARALHQNGMNHRDFYICHFLLDDSSVSSTATRDQLILYLIDLHRVQFRRQTPTRWLIKDIAALYFSSMDIGLTRRDLLRFIREYKNEPLPIALQRHQSFWRRVEKRGRAFYQEYIRKGRGPYRRNTEV